MTNEEQKNMQEQMQERTAIYFPKIGYISDLEELAGKKVLGVYEQNLEGDEDSITSTMLFNTDKGWFWFTNNGLYLNSEILSSTGICLGKKADDSLFLFWDGYSRSWMGYKQKNLEVYVDLGLAKVGLLGFVEEATKQFEIDTAKRELQDADEAIARAKAKKEELMAKLEKPTF